MKSEDKLMLMSTMFLLGTLLGLFLGIEIQRDRDVFTCEGVTSERLQEFYNRGFADADSQCETCAILNTCRSINFKEGEYYEHLRVG